MMAAAAALPPGAVARPDPWAAGEADTWSELLTELQQARPLARVRGALAWPACVRAARGWQCAFFVTAGAAVGR
jgi:hypothetical protein